MLADKVDHLTILAKERTTEGIVYAENLTLATSKEFLACSDKSHTILTKVYLQKELNKQVMVEMEYREDVRVFLIYVLRTFAVCSG